MPDDRQPPIPPDLELTTLDDYPWHQSITPFPLPATSDTRFNDGYYFGFFARGYFVFFGMRLYPNTNVIDGYGGAMVNGEQRNVRASRALRPRVQELEVGPLQLHVVEPMKRQRLVLLENPTGVTYDVTFTASADAYLESADIHYRRGRLLNHVLRYTQLARVTGTLTVDGESIEVDQWYGDRDHSWGIRASMGPRVSIKGVELTRGDPRAIRIWMPFEVGDHTGFFSLHEDSEGRRLDFDGMLLAADGTMTELVDVQHSFRYTPGSTRLIGGDYVLTDEHGATHEYSFETVAHPVSPQGYGYVNGWADGQSPGVWRGAEHLEHDRFDVSNPAVKSGPDRLPEEKRFDACEYAVEITGPNGATGMAQIEHMVYGPYRPYGFT